ncbi:MAG TPA: LysR family transcriptional regulator [Opitutaceae bacterium]
MPRRSVELRPRLRFPEPSPIAFGPGKADLLALIARTGSITKAAARMKMSYNRAWVLVRDMNKLFRKPLVATERGGSQGGGARITPEGREVLGRYVRMQAACLRATAADWRSLRSKLRR